MEKLSQRPGGSDTAARLTVENHVERRCDHKLRSAVDSIQSLLFDIDLKQSLYKTVLDELLALTRSNIGAAIHIDCSAPGTPVINTRVLVTRSHRDSHSEYVNVPRELALSPLSDFITNYLDTRRTQCFNAELPESLTGSFSRVTDQLENALVVPLFEDGLPCSLFIVANSTGGYHPSMLSRLHPLVAACECVMKASPDATRTLSSLASPISRDRYLCSLMSVSSSALILVDDSDAIRLFNPSAEKLLGLTRECHLGHGITAFLPDYHRLFGWPSESHEWMTVGDRETKPGLQSNVAAVSAGGRKLRVDAALFKSRRGGATYTTLLLDQHRTAVGSAHPQSDLDNKFDTLADLSPGGTIEVNEHWECVRANDKWFELSGLTPGQSRQTQWYRAINPGELQETLNELDLALSQNRPFKKEIRLICPRGKMRWVEMKARALRDNVGEVHGFLACFQDMSEQRHVRERLRRVAEHDALTGLANRVLFQDRLQQMLVATQRDKKMVALLIIDLDGFKDINDTLGHDAGDTLLKHVAKRLVNALRNEDTVARFGGDEFTVLLRHVQEGDYIPMVADKIIRTVSAPFLVNTHEVFVTASIGISVGNSLDCDAPTMIKQADIALHKAKSEGRNRFHYFTPEMDQQAHARLKLINSIHRALENDELRLEYQPQATIRSGMLTGFEALLRWRHPEMGRIPPKKFIPLMEESNVILKVGRWVLQRACCQLQQWRESGLVDSHVTMSINVSARQLSHGDLLADVVAAIAESNLPAENLVLEITESVLINKAESASKQIKKLKALGVRFALDDFGTGYSSLSYLQKFPIDQIKIDQSFVRDLLKDEQDANITRAIIALAHNLNMEVTAEGVVNEKTLQFLDREDCDHFQGFHLSRSRTAESLTTTLKLQRRAIPIEAKAGSQGL